MATKGKRLEARVRKDSELSMIRAFSGRDYNKLSWALVPAGAEDEAKRHPYLEVREFKGELKEEVILNERPQMPPVGGAGSDQFQHAGNTNPLGEVDEDADADAEVAQDEDSGESGRGSRSTRKKSNG
jgi:hypothetical protein